MLQDVVEGLESVLRRVAGEAVEFDFELEPTPLVYADIGRLEQVLVNLVANARDAMADGGLISIGTHSTTLRADRADRLGVPMGDYAVMAVSDTGVGIEPLDQERIFDEFQQVYAAQDGRRPGTGLGLPLARRLAGALGGRIELVSEPGKGSCFSLVLPR